MRKPLFSIEEATLTIQWQTNRFVEESNDKKAQDGNKVFVTNVPVELQSAASLPTGVFSAGYRLPENDATVFSLAEAIRVPLGFERTDSDLQHGGVAAMHTAGFDRFVREVQGTNWRLRLTFFAASTYMGVPSYILQVGSGSVMNRLLQGSDITNHLLPFVQKELEPLLQRLGII